MATIAYIDHSFHQKTLSTRFLPNLLTKYGHIVHYYWDDSWRGGSPVEWEAVSGYDVVIMFQAFCPIAGHRYRELHPNVIFIPMLDQFGIWQGPLFNLTSFWNRFQGSKTINFSHAAHAVSISFGIRSFYCKYFQNPTDISLQTRDGRHGFFWQRRTDQISWSTVKKLIGKTKFDSFHLHNAPDPGSPDSEIPSSEDIAEYKISISSWFENKEDLIRIINNSNIYFCPRMEEGIGQSFLEALSRGQAVVGPNNGTMNEYIHSGLNGYLFDPLDPQPINFNDMQSVQDAARRTAETGWSEWTLLEKRLIGYILEPSESAYSGKYAYSDSVTGFNAIAVDAARLVSQKFPTVGNIANKIRRIVFR